MAGPLEIVADAVNSAYSDPTVRTSTETAQRILDALRSAGFALVRLQDGCPHCGADNAGDCRNHGPCRWTN